MFDSTSCLVLQRVWNSPRPFIISALFAIVRYKYKSSQFYTHQYLLDFKSKKSLKNQFCAQFRVSWYFFFNVQFSRHSWVCRVRRGFQDTPPLMDPSPVPDIEICRHFYLNVPKDIAFRGKSGPLWFVFSLHGPLKTNKRPNRMATGRQTNY